MAVTSVASNSSSTSSAASLTTGFDMGAGANYMVAFVCFTHGSAVRTVDSVTYNGVSLEEVTDSANANGTHPGAAIYRWPDETALPTGSNDLVSTLSGSTDDILHGFQSFSGCASTQTGTGVGANGMPTGGGNSPQPSATVTGVADGLIVGVCCTGATRAQLTPGDSEVIDTETAVNNQTTVSLTNSTATGAHAVNWTGVPNFNPWGAGAFPLEPSAEGGDDFEATGDLDAQASTIAGSATVGRTSTGALAAQAFTIAGTATQSRAAVGALSAQAAVVSGTVIVSRTSSGALSSAAATISGDATNSGAPVVVVETRGGRGMLAAKHIRSRGRR